MFKVGFSFCFDAFDPTRSNAFFLFFRDSKNNSKIYLIFCPIPKNHNQIKVELIISFNLAKTIEIPVHAGILSNSAHYIHGSAIDYFPGKKGLLEIDLM